MGLNICLGEDENTFKSVVAVTITLNENAKSSHGSVNSV